MMFIYLWKMSKCEYEMNVQALNNFICKALVAKVFALLRLILWCRKGRSLTIKHKKITFYWQAQAWWLAKETVGGKQNLAYLTINKNNPKTMC